jgi:hypothetical protein
MNTVAVLGSLREHLTGFELPEPVGLSIASCPVGPVATVQVSGVDLSTLAGELTAWARTLDNLTVTVWRPAVPDEDLVQVELRGRLTDDTPVKVFGGLLDGPYLVAPGSRRALSFRSLRDWAVAA